MLATGTPYVQVSTTIGGLEIDPGNSQQVATISIGTPAVITVAAAPANLSKVKFYSTGILPIGLTDGLTYYVRNVSGPTFNLSLTATGALINTSGVQSGIHTMVLDDVYEIQQYTTDLPDFNISSSLGGFTAIVSYAGSGLAEENTFTILGTSVGGTTPENDVVITITSVDSNGGVTTVSTSGTGPGEVNSYYLKVISPNEFAVYSNPLMTVPVSGINFLYEPIFTTTGTTTTTITNVITVDDTTDFSLYDPVVFTGDVVGGLELGVVYYIYTITPTEVTVSTVPADVTTVVPLSNAVSTGFTMAKQGSLISIPTPFTFNQSIVKYNNRVYLCIISNNDTEFVFGKWELLTSGDRRLNALDRIFGYYQPTINMPGLDLTQLVDGITYPNSAYQGNDFAPAQQFAIDTILSDQPFYTNQVDTAAIVWDGSTYLGASGIGSNYSAIIRSADAAEWEIQKLASSDLLASDIVYQGNVYLMTTKTADAPIFRSLDGLVWSILTAPTNALNSIAYKDGAYVAVGENIISSSDSTSWAERYAFTNGLTNELHGISAINANSFEGFIAVGNGQTTTLIDGTFQEVNVNLVLTSPNGLSWSPATSVSRKGFNSTATDGNVIVAVGDDGVIYNSLNATSWYGINESAIVSVNESLNIINVTSTAGLVVNDPIRFTEAFNVFDTITTYYISAILTSTQVQVSATISGLAMTLTADNPDNPTWMYIYPRTATLADLAYANTIFIAVGDAGLIRTSSDGITWTTQTSGTVQNLNGLAFNDTANEWIAVGNNNTIIVSTDNGVTWASSSIIASDPTDYTVQGDEFTAGYGPEELVPGIVTDSLMMTVATRPGINWPVTIYAHNGYNVVSVVFTPINSIQTEYSFDRVQLSPSLITVAVVNGVTGLSTTIYQPDYSINWITNVITLANPLAFSPITDHLRVDVYETGNGDQLVKADTKTDPIQLNDTTGFNEIYVNANYCQTLYSGSGVVRPGTIPVETFASATVQSTDSIVVDDVSQFILNDPVRFYGDVLGGLVEDTIYYVKTISLVTSQITVSDSINLITGVAGSTFLLTNDTGLMNVVINTGPGTPWSDPIAFLNGTKLVHGSTGTVTRTKASINTITVNTTAGLSIGMPIVFSDTMFGGVIQPQTVYNVLTIYDINEFTVEDPGNPGNPLTLTNSTGGAVFVTNDYAFGIAPNGISAKIIFATGTYDDKVDFISYTLFGETLPVQYGYTLPETEQFTGTGALSTFALSNYVSGLNPNNAIVEVDGLRLANTDYTINDLTNVITFTAPPALNAKIAVTSFNLTDNQYFNTQFGITGVTVSTIVDINNAITPPIAITNVSATTTGTNYITCVTTGSFTSDQTVVFAGTGFGGILTDGTVYYIDVVVSGTQFTIKDENNNPIILSTATGLISATVGGVPAVRVTTANAHNLTTNDIVRIDGVLGSVQLNNNVYYARVINGTQFDLYTQLFDPTVGAVNSPVTDVSSYLGSGYASISTSVVLADTVATATSTDPILGNRITVSSTSNLVENTPVIFTGTTIGGIVEFTVYYVKTVYTATEFSISATWSGDEFILTNAAGSMNVCQWEQDNVDRLWVTINGYRVPSASLRINQGNYISILSEIVPADEIIITSMVPSATPNEEVYTLYVNQLNQAQVYRANTQSRTWLTMPLSFADAKIYVSDVSRITDTINQTAIAPAVVNNTFSIGLLGNKDALTSVSVYNSTTATTIDPSFYSVQIENMSPILVIQDSAPLVTGDALVITQLIGNLIYINGEQIKFSTVNPVVTAGNFVVGQQYIIESLGTTDFTLIGAASNTIGELFTATGVGAGTGTAKELNSVTGLQRGANGTAIQLNYPEDSEVFSMLPGNKLSAVDYGLTWNSEVFNTVAGDPLQISDTLPAQFLRGDVN